MRIGVTGGHSELLYDMVTLFKSLGHDVSVIGGMNDHKRPTLDNCSICRDSHEVIETRILQYISMYGDDPIKMIVGSPTLLEYCHDIEDHIKRIASLVDVFYGYLPRYVAIYYPYRKMFWHLVGGENITWKKAIDTVTDAGGVILCYAEAQAEQFSPMLEVQHFYKDPDEFNAWTGSEDSVLYMANSLHQRREACHEQFFLDTRVEDRWWLAGSNNQSYGYRAQEYSYPDLKSQMRMSRLFFNLGTAPAPYTLGTIEAAMTGMPIVTPDYQHQSPLPQYQVPGLFGKGCVIVEKRSQIEKLLKKKRKCVKIGKEARRAAINNFGINTIKSQWETRLNSPIDRD